MQTARRFSLRVFAPLYCALLVPALFLLPQTVLLLLLATFDPNVSASQAILSSLWVVGPILASLGLYLAGVRVYALYLDPSRRSFAWAILWAIFTLFLFFAVGLGVAIMSSLGASDYSAVDFFKWVGRSTLLVSLVLQPGVIIWLFMSAHSYRKSENFGDKTQHTGVAQQAAAPDASRR